MANDLAKKRGGICVLVDAKEREESLAELEIQDVGALAGILHRKFGIRQTLTTSMNLPVLPNCLPVYPIPSSKQALIHSLSALSKDHGAEK